MAEESVGMTTLVLPMFGEEGAELSVGKDARLR